jgi:hypothetical protein
MTKSSTFALFSVIGLLLVVIFITAPVTSAYAQDTPSTAPGEQTGTQPAPGVGAEIKQGVGHGVYWWVEPDAAAIGSLADFGVDTVSFRLGKITYGQDGGQDFQGVAPKQVAWQIDPDMARFQKLPQNLAYSFVIESDAAFWRDAPPVDLIAFLTNTVLPSLAQAGVTAKSIEIKMNGSIGASLPRITEFLTSVENGGLPVPVVLGLEPRAVDELTTGSVNPATFLKNGLTVYFLDYNYTGNSPRITDRAWIDATSSKINSMGIPFTVVLPVYNRALVYSKGSDGSPKLLPAIDLVKLAAASDARAMGAAGSEYVIKTPIENAGTSLVPGDRVLVVDSLKQLDIGKVMEEIPALAPKCVEIALFRFPMVPNFDPAPLDVFKSTGWIAPPPVEKAAEPNLVDKKALDQKYNKGQQFIMITTFALMAFLLMRVMSRAKQGEGTGGGGATPPAK